MKDGFESMGGVYLVSEARSTSSSIAEEEQSPSTKRRSWVSSGSETHHEGSPRVVRDSVAAKGVQGLLEDDKLFDLLGDEEVLGRIMVNSRKLPKNSGSFASMHVMVNSERTKKYMPPLRRDPEMDQSAREHAEAMAHANELSYCDELDLGVELDEPHRRLGQNIAKGSDLERIHRSMMKSIPDKNNLLDRRYTTVGLGSAKSKDGVLYICQIFRG